MLQEVQSLHRIFATTPIFGVDYTTEEKAAPLEQLTVTRAKDDVEIVDTDEQSHDVSAAYFADGPNRADREVVLSPELGLAIEKLPEGFTAKSLWSVI